MTRHSESSPRGMLWAIVLFAAIAPTVLMTAPAIAAQLVSEWGLGPAQIGNLFAVELAAMSLATLPAFYWQTRLDWRKVAWAAALAFVVFNLLSAFASSYAVLALLRFCSALAGGTLMVLCMASAARYDNQGRAYGLWVMGQLVVGAIGLWLLPPLFQRFGLSALYVGLAGLMLACLPWAHCFPRESAHKAAQAQQPRLATTRFGWRILLSIFAVLAFYVGLSAVWTFIGTIATQAGIDADTSGSVLAVASLFGIAGAGTASLIGNRWRRTPLLLVGYGAMAIAVLCLLNQPQLIRFAFAALLFKYTWTFVLPFVLATLAELDRDGRVMSTANLVIGSGLAMGPAIAGMLIETGGGQFGTVLAVSAILMMVSLSTLIAARGRSPQAEPLLVTNGVN